MRTRTERWARDTPPSAPVPPGGHVSAALTERTFSAIQNPSPPRCIASFGYSRRLLCKSQVKTPGRVDLLPTSHTAQSWRDRSGCRCRPGTAVAMPKDPRKGTRVPGVSSADARLGQSSAEGREGFAPLPSTKASLWPEDRGTGTFPGQHGSARRHTLSRPRRGQPTVPGAPAPATGYFFVDKVGYDYFVRAASLE